MCDVSRDVSSGCHLSKDISTKPPDAGAKFAERRSVPRYPFVAHAEIREPIRQIHLVGQTAEISVKGCFVSILSPLPTDTILQLRIHHDDTWFESWGRVVYAKDRVGLAVVFLAVQPEQQGIVADWVQKLG
jgi:PilZ domain